MSVKHKIEGNLQYPALAGYAADAWLTSWIASLPEGELQNHHANGHTLQSMSLHEEGCVLELTFEYHFEHADEAAFQARYAELTAAIYSGTAAPAVEASCDSGLSSTLE